MRDLNLQQVIVYKCEKFKFCHVGVYNMYNKKGHVNQDAKLSVIYYNATYAVKNANGINPKGTDSYFTSGFTVRLMNTGIEAWECDEVIENLDLDDAQKMSKQLVEKYEAAGYSITGSRGNKTIRQTGERAPNNHEIKNATMARIFEIVEKLTHGIENVNLFKVQKDIYKEYNYGALDTRRKFWNFIHERLDVYMN